MNKKEIFCLISSGLQSLQVKQVLVYSPTNRKKVFDLICLHTSTCLAWRDCKPLLVLHGGTVNCTCFYMVGLFASDR